MKALLRLSIESIAQGERQTAIESCTGIADSIDRTSVVLPILGFWQRLHQPGIARRFVVACEWTKEHPHVSAQKIPHVAS